MCSAGFGFIEEDIFMPTPALAAIAALPQADLKSIFTTDPDRLSKLVHQLGPIRFDWSKTHLTDDLVAGFLALADEQGFARRRDALFAGEAVNNTEAGRPSIPPNGARDIPTASPAQRRCITACARWSMR